MKSFDAIIVGAGIIGSAVARECARHGWRVAVVEGGVPAGAATAAGMGHLVVMDDSPAQIALGAYSQSLWNDEIKTLPRSVEFEQCGTVWVAADDEEMDEVRNKQRTYRDLGLAADVLNSEELASEEPNLRKGLAGGLLVPGDSVIYPPAASGYFLEEAQRLGCELILQRAVSAGEGRVVLADGTTLEAERIILAVGAESDLLPSMPIQKRKGHLIITDRYPGFVRHQLVELGYLKSAHKLTADSVAFNIQPRQTGQVLIGSSRQYGNTERAAEPDMLRKMIDRAVEYMPGIAKLSVLRVWTGFRAASKDKLPLIGPATGLSDDASLWLAAGFEGLGITNALGAARLLMDLMLEQQPAIDAAAFLPARLKAEESVAYA